MEKAVEERWKEMVIESQALYAHGLRILHSNLDLRDMLDHIARKLATLHGLRLSGGFEEILPHLNAELQGRLLWMGNKALHHPGTRASAADAIAAHIRKSLRRPPPPSTAEGQSFQSDGIFRLDGLVTASHASDMLAHFNGCADLEREETVLHHRTVDVLNAPHVVRIATDGRVLSLAEQHLGMPPTIVQITAWWSLPERESPYGAQIFHRDRDDFRACKLFVYLNDVSADDGPHIFATGTHRLDGVMKALAAKGVPPDAIGDYFTGDGRGVDSSIDDIFGEAVCEVTGAAGTAFLENTYGFHRGKVPKSGARCILQILYAAIPYPHRLKHAANAPPVSLPPDKECDAIARFAARHYTRKS